MLNQNNVELVRSYLKGKKLEKFNESVTVIEESMAQGRWTPRGSVKYSSGFCQGLCTPKPESEGNREEFNLYMCLRFGSVRKPELSAELYAKLAPAKRAPSFEVVQAWIDLIEEVQQIAHHLNTARPKPVITAVGLSPKVTKTLKEMNLDIDLSSISVPEIKMERVEDEMVPIVMWTPGTKFNRSRFYQGCQACGRPIPSGMYVPIEAKDLRSGDLIGLWIGCDCAKNIFGVKDVGMNR